jgi:hypothetical protein
MSGYTLFINENLNSLELENCLKNCSLTEKVIFIREYWLGISKEVKDTYTERAKIIEKEERINQKKIALANSQEALIWAEEDLADARLVLNIKKQDFAKAKEELEKEQKN